jgi:hypothetical protein
MFRKTAGRSSLNWVILTLLLALVLCQVSWAQGDNLWNIRENSDDRFHDNEPWLRPWRSSVDDGWGRWVGYWSYELQWGGVSTTGSSTGAFSISRPRDHQFHAWTYVRVETAQTISLSGSGDCDPRAFVNYAFDSPIGFPAGLNLNAGWNRIDITGYNQNDFYYFTCGSLANLVDIMNSSEILPPIADADGPYEENEGTMVIFDGSGSSDPDGDPLEYRWDFQDDGIWDTTWSFDPTAQHTYGDNWSGQVRLEVSDGSMTDTDTAPVTIHNVAPNAMIDFVHQPNPNFILPHHILTFGGSFTDPGWLDAHAALWDFDNGTTTPGIVIEENYPPDATGVAFVQYAYPQAGTYSVALTINDDDGGNGISAAWIVTVRTPGQAVQALDDYFQNLEEDAFRNNARQRKRALHNSLEAVVGQIEAGEYQDAINKLRNDIRAKADGSLGGNPKNDWITDPAAQQEICAMIDDIIANLQLLL